ncbi:YwmB family TATA-box binding protein [Lentibacillus daqui]|uniref:YwmB family TATA-box binding protein n=1 Tax=Lentibacillus daqui TaxID=2911514 RepID=UPI0022B08541|nr:YwmB family TATA-box binding protein [Lentibacillus daqui]
MKKTGLLLVLLLALITKATIGYTQAADDEMIDLATIVTKHDLTVENWQVTVREQMDRKNVNKLVKQLKNRYLVSTEKGENVIKYSFSGAHKVGGMTESFKVIVPTNTRYHSEVIAEISGDHWDRTIKQGYIRRMNALPENMFTKNAQVFTCLTTENNGTISSDYFLKELAKDLNIRQISTQTDSIKHSTVNKIIYGYTPLWDRNIKIMDEKVNVQVAINNNNEKPKLTIGTPILITEY